MPRRILALLLVAALGVAVGPGIAGAQEPRDDPDGNPATDDQPVPEQDIIPEPDSGRAPQDAGDRGGALQGVVLLLIVVGVGGIAALAMRESRRSRRSRQSRSLRRGPDDDRAQASSP